ncbi:MAG: hypothetical protein M3Q82_04800, partial [Actinomycetota bacterium]|nr:hypothetical protein [Actinomycetota bacterium]
TVNVCETWNGSDYQMEIAMQTSTLPEILQPDGAKTVAYANGSTSGYGADGSYHGAEAVGSQTFDYVQATSAEQQASYDDPYYGVVTNGFGGPGLENPYSMSPMEPSLSPTPGALSLPVAALRHGLERRGVRFLVNDLVETARTPNGRRRFTGQRGNESVTVERIVGRVTDRVKFPT